MTHFSPQIALRHVSKKGHALTITKTAQLRRPPSESELMNT
jgi:hypothetical protein